MHLSLSPPSPNVYFDTLPSRQPAETVQQQALILAQRCVLSWGSRRYTVSHDALDEETIATITKYIRENFTATLDGIPDTGWIVKPITRSGQLDT